MYVYLVFSKTKSTTKPFSTGAHYPKFTIFETSIFETSKFETSGSQNLLRFCPRSNVQP